MTFCQEHDIDENLIWEDFGLNEIDTIDSIWRDYEYYFTAVTHSENEKENVRFSLFTGKVDGKMWVDEIVVERDSDRDGLSDTVEEDVPCLDVENADTDNDGIPDGVEDADRNGVVGVNETDPCKWDSDGDGLRDGEEDANRNGLRDSGRNRPGSLGHRQRRHWRPRRDMGRIQPVE